MCYLNKPEGQQFGVALPPIHDRYVVEGGRWFIGYQIGLSEGRL